MFENLLLLLFSTLLISNAANGHLLDGYGYDETTELVEAGHRSLSASYSDDIYDLAQGEGERVLWHGIVGRAPFDSSLASPEENIDSSPGVGKKITLFFAQLNLSTLPLKHEKACAILHVHLQFVGMPWCKRSLDISPCDYFTDAYHPQEVAGDVRVVGEPEPRVENLPV